MSDGVKMVKTDDKGKVLDTVTAVKPDTITQLKARGYRVAEERGPELVDLPRGSHVIPGDIKSDPKGDAK